MKRWRQMLRWILPFAVSGGLLAWQFASIDVSGLLHQVRGAVGTVFVPALIAYSIFALWIESLSLSIPLRGWHHYVSLWTLARIKCASYLLYIVHYVVGAGALSILLRKRAGATVWEAGGVVLLIALFDMAMLIALSGIAAVFMGSQATAVRASVVVVGGVGLVGGFALLRLPGSLGPLDRLRELPLFRAARIVPLRQIIEIGVLRLVFVCAFLAVCTSALWAFDIRPPLLETVVNISIVAVVATLPIAVAGLGTSQAAFVELFEGWAEPGVLLACSLTLSAGLILARAALGFAFAYEFVREAIEVQRLEAEAE